MTPEPQEVHDRRVLEAKSVAVLVHEDLVSCILAEHLGNDTAPWAARIYGRLERMRVRDLALLVAVVMHDKAAEEASRLWSQLCTAKPEDVPR